MLDVLGALPSLSDLLGLVSEHGPVVAVVVIALYLQHHQSNRMLSGLLGGLDKVQAAQAEAAAQQAAAVVELKGIRADLNRTEAQLGKLAERQGEHGETISEHRAQLRDHARRIATLEGHLPPAGVPTMLRRPPAAERS